MKNILWIVLTILVLGGCMRSHIVVTGTSHVSGDDAAINLQTKLNSDELKKCRAVSISASGGMGFAINECQNEDHNVENGSLFHVHALVRCPNNTDPNN